LVGLSPTEHTSFILDTLPYGGFSPVRLQGRYIRRRLPVDSEVLASCGLHPSFVPSLPASYPRSEPRDAGRWYTSVQAAIAALPQGPSLRSGLCCPSPSSLIWPHAPHSQAQLDFAA
jgi:hypothetical protein